MTNSSAEIALTEEDLRRPLGPAWQGYLETTTRLLAVLEQELKSDFDLSMADYNLMMLLAQAPEGRMKMGQLAKAMVFAPSRLTYQVSVLEKRGLVTREKCAEDGRAWNAQLTEQGITLHRKAAVKHAHTVRDLFTSQLTLEDLDCLAKVFTKVAENLDN